MQPPPAMMINGRGPMRQTSYPLPPHVPPQAYEWCPCPAPPPPFPFPERWPQLFQQTALAGGGGSCWLTPTTNLSARFEVTPLLHSGGHSTQGSAYSMPHRHGGAHASSNNYVTQAMEDTEADCSSSYSASSSSSSTEEDSEYAFVLDDEWRDRFARKPAVRRAIVSATAPGTRHSANKHVPPRHSATRRKRGAIAHSNAQVREPTALQLAQQEARELEHARDQQRRRLMAKAAPAPCDAAACPVTDRAVVAEQSPSVQSVARLEALLHARFDSFCDAHAPAVWPQGRS